MSAQRIINPVVEQRQLDLLKQLESVVRGKDLNKFCGGSIDFRSTSPKEIPPLLISYYTHKGSNVNNSTDSSPINAKGSYTGISNFIRFPIPEKTLETEAMESLIKAGSAATFGRGQKEILDPTYRQAIKLSASDIATQFHPGSTNILNTLSRFLCEDVRNCFNVKAVLDKLNVYGPGGFFQSHVDTPRGVGHFGSLVVCLPTSLKGGELVLREPETGVEKVVDWSTDEPDAVLKWVAFLGSVQHEVLKVKEGYRVTLTYNLYHVDDSDAETLETHNAPNTTDVVAVPSIKMDSTTSVIQTILSKLNNDPDFAPDGCTLGYFCQHQYSTNIKGSTTVNPDEPPRHLLGRDLAFLNAAKSLSWTTEIVPVFDREPWGEEEKDSTSETPKNQTIWTGSHQTDINYLHIGKWGTSFVDFGYLDDNKNYLGVPDEMDIVCGSKKEVVWLGTKPHRFDYNTIILAYGNEPSIDYVWATTVVLVKVPKLEERDFGSPSSEELSINITVLVSCLQLQTTSVPKERSIRSSNNAKTLLQQLESVVRGGTLNKFCGGTIDYSQTSPQETAPLLIFHTNKDPNDQRLNWSIYYQPQPFTQGSQLKGGELVLRERETGVEKVVDWSTDEPEAVLKWVAFLGSVEHEVLEVKEGYRVTLTYNLYHVDEKVDGLYADVPNTTVAQASSLKMDSTTSVIQTILANLNNEPDFAPDGCTLRYFCQHKYSTNIKGARTVNPQEPPSRLLGRDLAFLNAAKYLGWNTEIVPVFHRQRWGYLKATDPPKNQTIWTGSHQTDLDYLHIGKWGISFKVHEDFREGSAMSDSSSNGSSRSKRSVNPVVNKRQLALLNKLESVIRGGNSLNKICNGSIDFSQTSPKESAPLLISYARKDSNEENSTDLSAASGNEILYTGIRFPCPNQDLETAAIESLIKAGSAATFGQGHMEVLDSTYRQAIKLSASEIATQFHPGSTNILNTLSRFLCEDVDKLTNVRAVLDKLNVYGPGGFFKSHLDTPRGVGHFGSLVICLPTRLKGGELVLRVPETGVEKVIDWSSDEPEAILKWVAFLGSVEHEVLEVKEGFRVTLTYNLYLVDECEYKTAETAREPNTTVAPAPSMKMDSTMSVIQSILSKLNNDRGFAPNGCTLGYFCHHTYSTDIKGPSIVGAREPQRRLLGRDLAFANVAKSLGWKTEIVPVFGKEKRYGYNSDDEYNKPRNSYSDSRQTNLNHFNIEKWGTSFAAFDDFEYFEEIEEFGRLDDKGQVFEEMKVVWLGEKPHRFDYKTMVSAYGNEPAVDFIWATMVVLVKVPKVDKRVRV
ncbi:hypothetical protein HDU76_003155 [Blyttiomyces sp. JEL0837]|nr:hypothetical protein HDU76_003155 [Blyttiomyces sp. JEL0837]